MGFLRNLSLTLKKTCFNLFDHFKSICHHALKCHFRSIFFYVNQLWSLDYFSWYSWSSFFQSITSRAVLSTQNFDDKKQAQLCRYNKPFLILIICRRHVFCGPLFVTVFWSFIPFFLPSKFYPHPFTGILYISIRT